MSTPREHTHDDDQDQAVKVDWFRAADTAVWIAAAVVAVIAAEWFFGKVIRAWVTSQATRLTKAAVPAVPES